MRRLNGPEAARVRGMTLAELLITSAVVGIMLVPLSLFITQSTRGVVRDQARTASQGAVRAALVDIERDINDANEVWFAGPAELQVLMDSRRAPWYDPADDPDGDGIPNREDPDDDGDALEAGDLLTFANAPPETPWAAGFDLDDDDDNNDGDRDVLCRYRYLPEKETLVRDFRYDMGDWTEPETLLESVTSCSFSYFGTLEALDGAPATWDADNDRLLEPDEIALMDGVGGAPGDPLDNFNERRYITMIRLSFQVESNRNVDAGTNIVTELSPPMMVAKRKYP